MSFRLWGSVKVFAGSASDIALPSVQVWFAVGVVTTGVPRTDAEKESDTDSPLPSVATTVMPTVCAVTGAVPLNASVAALKTPASPAVPDHSTNARRI